MKTLKTLCLLLLCASSAFAQSNPDDMFISGYVLDLSGQAVANHQVCVTFISNNPVLPSDTICTTTNANGYYTLTITNGSLTGPNVSFDVYTYDPCALFPIVQTVDNQQGTVNEADVDFAICNVNQGNCLAEITTSVDSTGGGLLFTLTGSGSGAA
ncbi:MAG: carboxypeptidase-like regulatory domain-containing protein, partial [Flavobacteriales bacterium]|nr:carboxypeptidase-like regulatory domain-containing protein [Flavobacteriales bacterium]